MTYPANNALGSYRANGAMMAMNHANPHQLIDLLMERAISRLAIARGHMQRDQTHGKGEHISGAMAIITGLQSFLDHSSGGEIAAKLDALYDYMGRKLVQANVQNDISALEEVTTLLKEIRQGWQGIEQQVNQAGAIAPQAV
ncbi:MAG: flagellar export chaperone FliS [Gammaproteobacteria bacterium]